MVVGHYQYRQDEKESIYGKIEHHYYCLKVKELVSPLYSKGAVLLPSITQRNASTRVVTLGPMNDRLSPLSEPINDLNDRVSTVYPVYIQ